MKLNTSQNSKFFRFQNIFVALMEDRKEGEKNMMVKEIAICFEEDVDLAGNVQVELECAIDEILTKYGLEKECLLYA